MGTVLTDIGPKGPNLDFLGIGVGAVQKFPQPMPAGQGKPKVCVLRAIGPKGPNLDFLGVGVRAIQKCSQPMPTGKGKPKGVCFKGYRPEGSTSRFFRGRCGGGSKIFAADAGRKG